METMTAEQLQNDHRLSSEDKGSIEGWVRDWANDGIAEVPLLAEAMRGYLVNRILDMEPFRENQHLTAEAGAFAAGWTANMREV